MRKNALNSIFHDIERLEMIPAVMSLINHNDSNITKPHLQPHTYVLVLQCLLSWKLHFRIVFSNCYICVWFGCVCMYFHFYFKILFFFDLCNLKWLLFQVKVVTTQKARKIIYRPWKKWLTLHHLMSLAVRNLSFHYFSTLI